MASASHSDVDELTTLTVFGGESHPLVEKIRCRRKVINDLRYDHACMDDLDEDKVEDFAPDVDAARSRYAEAVSSYVREVRVWVFNADLDPLTERDLLENVAISVDPMRKAWEKTKYYTEANSLICLFPSDAQIKRPTRGDDELMACPGYKRRMNVTSATQDTNVPDLVRPRNSSPMTASASGCSGRLMPPTAVEDGKDSHRRDISPISGDRDRVEE